MYIEPFGVEQWMNRYETRCEFNLAETCVASLSLSQLFDLVGANDPWSPIMDRAMTYGDITGSARLRGRVAALFADQAPENVLIAHGTIGANALVYQTLVEPGDRVVSVVPTYQQHVSMPESLGADVVQVRLSAEADYALDMDALAQAAKGAKLIALVNPNNPTGAVLDHAALTRLAQIARENDAWVLCDEVYRGTEQGAPVPSIRDVYDKSISTGSMSKAFALAGLRLGWIVAAPEVLTAIELHRDYTTISVGIVDDHLAALALEASDLILARSRQMVRDNAATVAAWVAEHDGVDWVAPQAGTTALLHYRGDRPSYEVAEAILRDTGVLLTPGGVLGAEGTLRIGYANHAPILKAGLARLGPWLDAL